MPNWFKILLLSAMVICLPVNGAYAQRANTVKPAVKNEAVKRFGGMSEEEITATFNKSFLFSPAEVALIQKALKGLDAETKALGLEKKKKDQIPQRRVIQLSGVLYRGEGDWVVWMNNQKVTPDKLLPEIIEIEVKNSSYVKLKWYDVGLNAVISITLRPHQTYDITTGILLPG